MSVDSNTPRATLTSVAEPLSLRRNFAWTLFGNVVYVGCQWGMLIVLAKVGTPGMVGQFALGLAVAAPMIMLTNLQLRALMATDAVRRFSFGNYLAVRLASSAFALFAIAVIGLTVYGGDTGQIVIAIGLAKVIEAVTDVFYGLFQQHERMDRIAFSQLLKGPISLLAFTAAVYFSGQVLWGALALASTWLVLLLTVDLRNAGWVLRGQRELQFRMPRVELVLLLRLGLPLGLVMMLLSVNVNAPRFFVEHWHGAGQLGIFTALAYLMTAGELIMTALGTSFSPRLARLDAAGEHTAFAALLARMVIVAATFGASLVVVAAIAGRPLLELIYSAEYAAQSRALIWLAAAAGLSWIASVFGFAATATRRIKYQPVALAVVLATTLIASFIFVPHGAVIGAAMAAFSGAAISVGAYWMLLKGRRT